LIIKQLKQPAPMQRCLLIHMQEVKWAKHAFDPLPKDFDMDPRRRLHDTLKNLTHNQVNKRVRFFGDGTGRGICWELLRKQKQ
jgi:hypothetical protein